MAPAAATGSGYNNTAIPTEKDVTIAGGVWAPTSAKRDALSELQIEAESNDLDKEASENEKLDLYLVDGMIAISKVVDQVVSVENDLLSVWWREEVQALLASKSGQLFQIHWEEILRGILLKADQQLDKVSREDCFREIRDYVDPESIPKDDKDALPKLLGAETSLVLPQTVGHFENAVLRFRLLHLKASAQYLLDSWNDLIVVSDHDIDRAAVNGQPAPKIESIARDDLAEVLRTFAIGSCVERVDALWQLLDHDGDGLLEQDEMNRVCEFAIAPVGVALKELLKEALEAGPVRSTFLDKSEGGEEREQPKQGWRQRLQEKAIKRQLTRMLEKTVKFHFRDEVELPHRLRCTYAWSNKKHQDNSIDSVLVEDTAGSSWSSGGRKRYVELPPKISLDEFREVQSIHLTHLDRLAQEFLKSYREDILVVQGKGRQRNELLRNSVLFVAVVSLIDFGITIL